MSKVDLKALGIDEIKAFIAQKGLPQYRARQLLHWIYGKQASSIEEITEFSRPLRQSLAEGVYISNLQVIRSQRSTDGTEKFLLALADGESIETVLMPDIDRATLCISTQVGCAMGCRFCRTGYMGFRRNLMAHEIVDQVITLRRIGRVVTNFVMMGMGEPLKNLSAVTDALWRLTELMGISPKRVTLSTVGIPEGLRLLSKGAPPVNLAVSLNAPNNRLRGEIMPISKQYPLEELIETLRRYPLRRGRRITFEYVLLRDVNDSLEAAEGLSRLVKGIPSKINLISHNPFEGSPYKPPQEAQVLRFQQVLIQRGLSVFIRKSRGADIDAACGQLIYREVSDSEKC